MAGSAHSQESVSKMRQFFETELDNIPGKKIITYTGLFNRGNFDMTDSQLTSTTMNALKRAMSPVFATGAGVVVRRFTPEVHSSGLPVKAVRMFVILPGGSWVRASPEEVRTAQNTGPDGEALPDEPAVRYE